MKDKQFEFTEETSQQIGDINSNPALSPEEKNEAIKNLNGGSIQERMDFKNKNFRNFEVTE